MPPELAEIQRRLWDAADELRANSGLQAAEYSQPVLGLIFLRFAEQRFTEASDRVGPGTPRNPIGPDDYKAEGVLFLPDAARYGYLLDQPESADIGAIVNQAMAATESHNPDLQGVLPKVYTTLPSKTLFELLRTINQLADIPGDRFGLVYEYFLAQFAMAEGAGGGEFFTPSSIVKLIVEVLEPHHGKVLDPACGSGGMFVQSAEFVERHSGSASSELSLYGQEASRRTVPLAKMNLAVHGLSGVILEGNSYYDDLHDSVGRFDFVMANPPFNVNKVDKKRLEDDPRFSLGLPTTDNANYLWIQMFVAALNENGRAGFVMANSASDARGSELEIRRKLIKSRVVDVLVAVGTNMFFTVTLPVTLWFLDRGKASGPRADSVLFIDARSIYNEIDRVHRDWSPLDIERIANIVRLWRDNSPEIDSGSGDWLDATFPGARYQDVPGLCAVASIDEIEENGWSLAPGRYVDPVVERLDDEVFSQRIEALARDFRSLKAESRELESAVESVLREAGG